MRSTRDYDVSPPGDSSPKTGGRAVFVFIQSGGRLAQRPLKDFAAPAEMFLAAGGQTSASRRTLSMAVCASVSGRVRDEQVERIPRPGSWRREGLEGISEIFTVRAVHRC
jgi:hypothetical protein